MGETMSLLDLLRQEYIQGKVIDKYRLNNGNIGLVIEQLGINKKYHVEFRDDYRGPCVENLFGLLNDPFSRKTEHVERLINKGDSIELTLSYSRSPLREAYYIHAVSGSKPSQMPQKNTQKLINLPYKSGKTAQY